MIWYDLFLDGQRVNFSDNSVTDLGDDGFCCFFWETFTTLVVLQDISRPSHKVIQPF